MRLWPTTPWWGRVPAIALVWVCAIVVPASAQPRSKKSDKSEPTSSQPTKVDPKGEAKAAEPADKAPKKAAVKNFDFTGLDLNGRMRTPQLLYFLERANEELERASLEKRSFIPHMVRTVEEEAL